MICNGSVQKRPSRWVIMLAWLTAAGALLLTTVLLRPPGAHAAGTLTVEINTAYNLIVDSNVTSPSTYAPSVATVMGKFCNSGTSDLTNVNGYIGNYNGGVGSTPGLYPALNTNDASFVTNYPHLAYLSNTGSYAFKHLGGQIGLADATRYMGKLAPGQCKIQYWHFTYPQCANTPAGAAVAPPCTTTPTWGTSVKPFDDLSLRFDIWGTSAQGSTGNRSWTMTMRNEISAMANKIRPNPDGRWFNTDTSSIVPGSVITTNGVLYELGNIRQGFDNNGDFVPDYNAWMQPIGAPNYDPSCFRLIGASTVLTVSRNAGQPNLIITANDLNPDPYYGGPMYFTNLPPDNSGVRGEVRYSFLGLGSNCSIPLSPYQEVASGSDNEKFNGDFGTGIPPVVTTASELTMTKSSSPGTIALGTINTYNIPFANSSTSSSLGLILSTSGVVMPLVISDTVPVGSQYVANSAAVVFDYTPASSPGYAIRYSTNKGSTWTTGDPGNYTSTSSNPLWLQFWLSDPVPKNSGVNTSSARATFQTLIPANYISSGNPPVFENCASGSLGGAAALEETCTTVFIAGNNTLGDFVWRDLNLNGAQDGGSETGIANITVSLYYDRNGNGTLDSTDPFMRATTTNGSGIYSFTNLPDGRYLVQVNSADANLPTGYTNTTAATRAVALDPTGASASGVTDNTADFGFGPALTVDKSLVSSNPAYVGENVTYRIQLFNNLPGDGTAQGFCSYTIWASVQPPADGTPSSGSGNSAWQNPSFLLGRPNNQYATTVMSDNADIVGISGFNLTGQTGAITGVRLLAHVKEVKNLQASTSEYLRFEVFRNNLVHQTSDYDGLNYFTGPGGSTYIINQAVNAPTGGWQWSDFQNNAMELRATGSGTGSPNLRGDVGIDAVAYVVTTNQQCGGAASTISVLPLTDTFDNTKLQFVSATPAATSVSGGTINWSNVGPLYAGGTKTITVTFKALTTVASTVNTASVTGAKFGTGRSANDGSDTASVGINASGSIAGVLWAESTSTVPATWTSPTGYDGSDTFIPNVQVELWGCYVAATNELLTLGAATTGKPCSDTANAGVWRRIRTTTTSSGGAYAFTGLRDGFYNVKVVETTLPAGFTSRSGRTTQDASSGSATGTGFGCGTCTTGTAGVEWLWYSEASNLSVFNSINNSSGGENIPQVNFGYRNGSGNGAITGYVWNDRPTADGIWSTGTEEPIAGVTVYLCTSSPCNAGFAVATTTTDANGYYVFSNRTPGTYYVGVAAPSGMSQSGDPDQPGAVCTTCDNQTTSPINLAARQVAGPYNFGYTGGLTIGDTIFTDWNGNGVQETGEEGISGVKLELYRDLDGNGLIDSGDTLLDTQTTNSSGVYQFANLAGGGNQYLVRVLSSTLPAGYVQTADPDQPGVACSTCDNKQVVTLNATSVTTADFGYRPRGTASIGDYVWFDRNADKIQDSGETGVSGVTVFLYQDDLGDGVIDASDALVATTTTDSNGNYTFANLSAGNYIVKIADANFNSGQPLAGYTLTNSGTPYNSGQRSYRVALQANQTFTAADFGFASSAIGDLIWQDNNGDGTQDAGEPGIAGVTARLHSFTDANGNGYFDAGDTLGPQLASTTTNGSGIYEFTGLSAGNYAVVVDTATGGLASLTQTYDPDSSPSSPPCGACDNIAGTSLTLGQVNRSLDFGYRPPVRLGDSLWIDSNGDGQRDIGEQGIGNITVTLYDCGANGICEAGSGDDTIYAATATDLDGYYSFANMPNGKYQVVVNTADPDFPPGLVNTYDPDGATDQRTEVVVSGGAVTSVGGACTGDCSLTADFGYQFTGTNSISGTVFHDDNNDGVQAVAETTTYAGVTVYLVNCGADANCGTAGDNYLVATQQTNGSGDYNFASLPNGTYAVSVNQNATGLTGLSATPTAAPVTYRSGLILSGGTNLVDQDFGFLSRVDMGDLPDSYGTLLASDGARHIIPTSGAVYLGTAGTTTEPDGKVSATATGDDFEDGVVMTPAVNWFLGTASVNVTVAGCSSSCYLSAWFDWDKDGTFAQADNRALLDRAVTNGTQTISFPIPSGTDLSTGVINARFRLYASSTGGRAQPTGVATNGEVEDYQWSFAPTAVTLREAAAPQQSALTGALLALFCTMLLLTRVALRRLPVRA